MAIERSIRINVETGRAKAELRSLKGSLRETSVEARATATATRALTAAIAGVASIQSARALLTTADSYTNLQNKIRTVIDSTESLGAVTNRLFDISNKSRTGIAATVDLYQKLSINTKALGASQEDLFRVIETVAKAGAVANDGNESLAASLTQLGQAFGGDFKANAEELNSILSQTPFLADAIAKGIGREANELKKLGEEGVLSSELIFKGLLNISKTVDDRFSKSVANVSAALGILSNSATKYIGEVDQANGVTASISKTIQNLANNFEDIANTAASIATPAITGLALVIGGRLAGSIAAATAATASNIAVSIAQGKAIAANTALEADKAAVIQFSTLATVKQAQAEEASTLTAIASVKAVQAQLVAERELEVVRLKAQITDTGRALSIARLAEIRTAEAAVTLQATAAENANSAAKAKSIIAYNTFTAASTAATAATAAHARALKASTLAANSSALAVGGLRGALALVGGPSGAALIAAFGVYKLADAISASRREAERTEVATENLAGAFKELGREQLNQARSQAVAKLAELRQEQEQFSVTTKEASDSIAKNNTLLGGLGGQLAKGSQLYKENTEERIKNTAQINAATVALKSLNAELGISSDETDETAKNTELVAAAYKKLRSEVDRAFKLEQDYLELKEKINKNLPDGAQKTELLRKAEQDYRKNLEQLNDKTRKAAERNAKLHRSYEDLRGEFEETSKIAFEYGEIMKEIANSTATDAEKKQLQSLAYRKLQEDIDGATTTGQEFLAQFDQIAAAEVQRTESLKELEKVQASSAEKQKLAAEIQRQYNKDIDAATPSLIRLNAQFSAVDAATVAYVDTLKELDEAERKGLDVTNLRTSALKAYKKAAEEARKHDILNTETNKTFFGAFAQGLNDTAQTAESSFDKIREFGRETVDTLSDSFTEFVTTGEFNFKSFASNIIAELLRIQTQALILEGLDIFGEKRDSGGGFLESAASAIGGVFGGEDKDGGGGIASFFGFGGGDKSTTGGGEEEPLRLGGLFDGGGDSGFGQESAEMFGETWASTLDTVGSQFDEVFGNALAQSDQLGSSTESAAASIGTSLVGSLIKMGAQALINATVGTATTAALTTAGTAAASTLAAAWAPAAAAVSLATLGTNAVPAATGITTTYALTSTLSAASTAGGGGGTFARGGVELSDLSGSVISTPTKFAAGGSFNNQLGEAGAEAILPLQKTAGGELGVKATMEGMQMQQAAPQVNVPVRVVNVSRDPEDFLSSSEGEKVIVNIMNRNKGVFQA